MASKEPVRVLVTGAAGKIELVHKFAGRCMLGADQPVILHLLDIPSAAVALNDLKKKLVDCAFPLLVDVVATTVVVEACTGVNIAVVDVGFSGTEAKDFMPFYKSLALALGLHAAADLEILAVGDPANANELFSASSIPMKNFTCLAKLYHYLAERLNVPANRVENAIICGNCPSTPYSDTNLSSAMSAASSARDHIRDWGTWVSMGEDSDGSHGVPAGRNGTWSIVEDLGTPTPAIFQSEVEGKIKQTEERLEMISNLLEEMENRAGTALHHYSSIIYEFDRHAERAFENVCNKIEFLEGEIANLESNLANAQVYLHRALQEVAKWCQLYWNLRSRVIASRVSVPVPND